MGFESGALLTKICRTWSVDGSTPHVCMAGPKRTERSQGLTP